MAELLVPAGVAQVMLGAEDLLDFEHLSKFACFLAIVVIGGFMLRWMLKADDRRRK